MAKMIRKKFPHVYVEVAMDRKAFCESLREARRWAYADGCTHYSLNGGTPRALVGNGLVLTAEDKAHHRRLTADRRRV